MVHGSFSPASLVAITANPAWRLRLDKPHAQRTTSLPAPCDSTAKEMDSCTSSDALLMNCFCYPAVVQGEIARLLHVAPGSIPEFGVDGLVPLVDGKCDTTEIDMCLGTTNVEAKLTESDFSRKPKARVEQYDGLHAVFDSALLPVEGDDS